MASLTTPRVSLVCGGLLCTGAVGVVCLLLPAFTGYRARAAGAPAAQRATDLRGMT